MPDIPIMDRFQEAPIQRRQHWNFEIEIVS